MRDLLILNLGGISFGVWRDEIISIRDVQTIHRLPLTPMCIAGMSILDGRTVTLADLAVCIGLSPISRDCAQHILLLSETEKMTGFVVDGGIGSAEISDDAILSMPGYLKSAVIETCAEYQSEPIPIINISSLYGRLQTAEREPPSAEFRIPEVLPLNASSLTRVRVFESGGELFASADRGIEETSIRPGRVSRLALLPQYVAGITHHNGRILPLINLARLMKLPAKNAGPLMLTADISGSGFGLMIDGDHGALNSKEFSVKPLPHIAVSAWMKAAVLREGKILPLIDLGILMSVSTEVIEKPVYELYNPESRFHSIFGKEVVDVFEFSLLGARHALPKSEVVDTIRFKPYRPLPNVQPIVIGVTEHDGELLPVLDLAMCFGRRSLATHEWSMILVRNGDFRCMVITEAAFGERRLPMDMQRMVPISVPHNIVYGCYPDANVVKLILNVYALAVNFDRSLVRDLLPALSREMQEAPAEIVQDLLDHEDIAGSKEMEESKEFALYAERKETEEPRVYVESVKPEEPIEHREPKGPEASEVPEKPIAPHEAEIAPELRAASASVSEQPDAGPETRSVSESQTRSGHEAQHEHEAVSHPAVTQTPESEPKPDAQPQPESPSEHEEILRHDIMPGPEPQPPEPEPESEPQPQNGPAATDEKYEEKLSVSELVPAEEQTISPEAVSKAQEEVGTTPVYEVHEVINTPVKGEYIPVAAKEKCEQPEPAMPVQERIAPIPERTIMPKRAETERFEQMPSAEYAVPSREGGHKRIISYAAIAAVLVALLYFAGLFEKPIIDKAFDDEKIKTVAPAPGIPQKQPPAGPISELYEVKKGDTLWHISRRFTGSPFNYPQVAKENDIKNPDLIFPGQMIHVKK